MQAESLFIQTSNTKTMKKQHLLFLFAWPLVVTTVSCKKQEVFKEVVTPPDQIATMALPAVVEHPGRSLAANCFQCHGTNGFAGQLKIASMGASEIITKFNGYRAKAANADIMYLHSQAYTVDEINLIADFFSKQQ